MYIRCPYYKQTTNYSCGPTSIKMLLDFWENEQEFSEETLINYLHAKPLVWVDNDTIINFFAHYWYNVYFSKKWNIDIIEKFIFLWLPVLVNYRNLLWWNGHFAVIVGVKDSYFILNDPNYWESYRVTKKAFLENWLNSTGEIENWFLVPIKESYFRFYDLGELQKWFIWI